MGPSAEQEGEALKDTASKALFFGTSVEVDCGLKIPVSELRFPVRWAS